MKAQLVGAIEEAIQDLQKQDVLAKNINIEIKIERSRAAGYGDYACTVALLLAKQAKRPPMEIAQLIVDALKLPSGIEKIEIANPGFINFFLSAFCRNETLIEILKQGEQYGHSEQIDQPSVVVEFVSANPTGPLHVGHGRGAAFGDSLARILKTTGFNVQSEYYLNDRGRQVEILALSIWLRYLELCGERFLFPVAAYQGEYIIEIARNMRAKYGDDWRKNAQFVNAIDADHLAEDQLIDALIAAAKEEIGQQAFTECLAYGLEAIKQDIEQNLENFKITYDHWFSEQSLYDNDKLNSAIKLLQAKNLIYMQEDALWFKASSLGDTKDRVVQRSNGKFTYFASDIAYLLDKFERGFDHILYVFGADHHGYIPRLKAVAQGLGQNPEKIEVLLVQFAHLYQQGEKLPMSTRSGQFITLQELQEKVGVDAARFFYVMRSHEQHLDFDLDLAVSKSNENPVYYIQYAHARICSVLSQVESAELELLSDVKSIDLNQLELEKEIAIINFLSKYPELLTGVVKNRSPHLLAHYLKDLANLFHGYYAEAKLLVKEQALREARLVLALAIKQVLYNGLSLLGVSSPESM